MLTIISPAKKLNLQQDYKIKKTSFPEFFGDSCELVKILKNYNQADIQKLMKLSDDLAELNYKRYQNFSYQKTKENCYPAIFTFAGEVYNGLAAHEFSEQDLNFANNNLRILSGLYGILKPTDLISAYRLEMGTKLANEKGKNLHEFWRENLTKYINEAGHDSLINLASTEYFGALDRKKLNLEIITPIFKDFKNGNYKVIMMYAKKARGMLSRYIIQNKIENWQDIKKFNLDGYRFNLEMSKLDANNKELIFTR